MLRVNNLARGGPNQKDEEGCLVWPVCVAVAHRLGGQCREIIDTRFDRRWVAVGGASIDNAKQALVLTP